MEKERETSLREEANFGGEKKERIGNGPQNPQRQIDILHSPGSPESVQDMNPNDSRAPLPQGQEAQRTPAPLKPFPWPLSSSEGVNSQYSQDLIPRQSENTQVLNKPCSPLTAASLRKNQFCLQEAVCAAAFPDVGDDN